MIIWVYDVYIYMYDVRGSLYYLDIFSLFFYSVNGF